MEGIFHSFPYLHMIAVKNEYQNQGIGTLLLDFFENDVLLHGKNQMRTKVFLLVGDFNRTAEQIYQKRGYQEICQIEGLYRRTITEKLMMKTVVKNV